MAVTPPARRSADTAVQLTTLTGWRQFVTAVPSVPDLLPEQEWLSLEDGKRASHDNERLEHHCRLVVVQTPVIGRIITQGGNLIRMNRLAHYGRSGLRCACHWANRGGPANDRMAGTPCPLPRRA